MTCQSRTHPDMSRRMSGSDGNSVRGWSCSHWEQTSSISSMTRAVIQIGDNWLSAVFPSARGGTSDDLALSLPKLSFTCAAVCSRRSGDGCGYAGRSEEHTSELQSLMRSSYAVFCLKKKNTHTYNK